MSKEQNFKSNKNVVYSCKYHVVWATKYRRHVLDEAIQKRFVEIVQETTDELQCEILEIETMTDHVHMLCEVDPQFGIHKFVKRIKGRTSRLLRQEFPSLTTRLPTLWTNSYFVSTVGRAPLEVIRQYIENQKNA